MDSPILDTLFDDDSLDLLLSDDATVSTGSNDGVFYWVLAFLPLEMLFGALLLVSVGCLIYKCLENLVELLELLGELLRGIFALIWIIIYRFVNEQAQTASANMIPLTASLMQSESKSGGVVLSYAPRSSVEKQRRMALFKKK